MTVSQTFLRVGSALVNIYAVQMSKPPQESDNIEELNKGTTIELIARNGSQQWIGADDSVLTDLKNGFKVEIRSVVYKPMIHVLEIDQVMSVYSIRVCCTSELDQSQLFEERLRIAAAVEELNGGGNAPAFIGRC